MVNVISPSSFVLQKLLINDLRKTEKKEKDINAVKYVLSYIKMTKNHFSNLKETYDQLPKKWRKTIDKSCAENNLKLFD